MVFVAEVDSDGNEVGETIRQDVAEMILTTGSGMLAAIGKAADSLSKMSVSPEVVGEDVSVVLTVWREGVVHYLLVFKEVILPLSQKCLNDVEKTLRTYFGTYSTLDQFRKLLPRLKDRLGPRIKGARDAKIKIGLLSSDLLSLSRLYDNELTSAKHQMEEARTNLSKHAIQAKQSAKRMDSIGSTAKFGTIACTLALAKGLVTTGGVIVAIPQLAPLVLGVGLYLATVSKDEASSSARAHQANEEKLQALCEQVSETLRSVADMNGQCIRKLANCLQSFVDLFTYIQSQLEQMSDPDCEIDDPDEQLESFFKDLKTQASEVIGACSKFNSCCARVEIAVKFLDQFKSIDSTERMAEWIERANAEVKKTSN